MSDNNKIALIDKIYQFLCHEVENSNLSESAKESLTVASECIEQAYKLNKPPPSDELLKIFVAGKKQQQQQPQTQHIYPELFVGAHTSAGAQPPSSTNANANANTTPKVRKNPTEEERKQAEDFKNQGNDLMKQDKYKEAYDCYTKALDLDNNNAVYYSNRAASLSKLGDHNSALNDCLEAIEIDPSYSKAYGRMGLAYASMENHAKAKEAYEKAVQLDPNNQSYQNNLKIAEEKLRSGGADINIHQFGRSIMEGLNTGGMDIASILQNPNTLQTIMRRMQDPNMQNIINTVVSASANIFNPATATGSEQGTPQETATQQQSAPEQQTQQPSSQQQPGQAASAATTDAPPPPNPMTGLLAAGQQIASALQQSNPNFLEDMRRMFEGPRQDNPDQNPPPGYS